MKLKTLGAAAVAVLALTLPSQGAPLAYEPLANLPDYSIPQGLVEAADGNFYGSTYFGGSNNLGYIFRVTPSGATTVLTNFSGPNGSNPSGNLVLGTNGMIYGLTRSGGATDHGTIFSISTNGTVTTVHSCSYPSGVEPTDLILGHDGNLYGVNAASLNGGNIFRLTHDGAFSVVQEIDFNSGGYTALSLLQDTNGNFYGTTSAGSTNNGGSLFKLSTNGTMTILHAFAQQNLSPRVAGVIKGVVYGYTERGGTENFGSFFKVTTNGVLTTITSFNYATGCYLSDMRLDADGSFYATATSGGAYNGGAYLKVSPSGGITPVINLSGLQYGPEVVIKGSDGNFYGGCIYINSTAGVSGIFKTIGASYGTFSGLFSPNSGVTMGTSGHITVKLSSDFKYSGKLIIEGVTYPITGELPYGSIGSTQVIRAGKTTLTVTLQLVHTDGAYYLTGTVSDGNWSASFLGDRAYFSATELTPKAGLYSMTLLANGDGTAAPGYGSSLQVLVKTNGLVKINGKLSDMATFSQATTLSRASQFPLYANLYKGTGMVTGWITLTNSSNSRLQGDVVWIKTNAAGNFYSNGFTNIMPAVGSALQ